MDFIIGVLVFFGLSLSWWLLFEEHQRGMSKSAVGVLVLVLLIGSQLVANYFDKNAVVTWATLGSAWLCALSYWCAAQSQKMTFEQSWVYRKL